MTSDGNFAKIVRSVELLDITPTKVLAEVEGREELPEIDEMQVNLEDRARWTVAEDRASVDADIEFSFLAKAATDNPSSSFRFSATVTYSVRYSFDPPLPTDADTGRALVIFMQHNPRYNAWPFLREYLNYASGAMGLPLVSLPLLKPYASDAKDAEAEPSATDPG